MGKVLLIGAGSSKQKLIGCHENVNWCGDVVTLDNNKDHSPDVVWDLEQLPYPFMDSEFDEIHGYEVLEHTGFQGDWKFFFDQFSEFHRILKPGGVFCATVPRWDRKWGWGDPSHKRIINEGTLVFLDQDEYKKQIGHTAMSDFRYYYKADFKCVWGEIGQDILKFILVAKK